MRLGLQLNSFDWDEGPARLAANLADIARAAVLQPGRYNCE